MPGNRYGKNGHGYRAKLIEAGTRFRMLTVVKLVGSKPGVGLLYECLCDCGKKTIQPGCQLRYKNGRKSCGCYQPSHRKGEWNDLWKGGRYVSAAGYVYIRHEGPNANRRGYALEHVVVMAKKLGRPIVRGESVHHMNGVRADNRPSNLELWYRGQPAGQRVADLVLYAVEILTRYAPERLKRKA